MPDLIVGIAVLKIKPLPHLLRIKCQNEKGTVYIEDLPVFPRGTTKPTEPCWAYDVQGDSLNVTPSVWIRLPGNTPDQFTTLFHNEGQWSVKFKMCPPGQDAYALFKELNP